MCKQKSKPVGKEEEELASAETRFQPVEEEESLKEGQIFVYLLVLNSAYLEGVGRGPE
jgi:hypothetical protein